ncbi:MAG: sigma-54-dependent Fis family transcriptional regulator [Archangiaceae bacterium]|nr:sigma-54-dependent Fis family transcriptional regulator [Archangiaceae bacterium]
MNLAFANTSVPTSTSLVHAPGSPLEEVIKAVARIAPTDSTVLLTGETGTGKEVIARYVHENSPRARRHFVPVNCGAIPETLLESELFGHVRGAFTGAVANRKGRVAMAEGGTLFLDEIGEMPLPLQVKLLRLLQERTYEPVGSAESVSANFRLIAATNRKLAEEVEAGRFRRDLYYRLMVCPVELPPLRSRKADVLALFNHFWRQRGETRPIEPAAMRAIELHPWPGNVRELENLVERVSVCTEGPVIRVTDLPSPVRQAAMAIGELQTPSLTLVPPPPATPPEFGLDAPQPVPTPMPRGFEPLPSEAPVMQVPVPERLLAEAAAPSLPIDLPALLRTLEDTYIAVALQQAKGNRKAAADLLGLQRTTLVEKLRRRARESQAA